MATIQEIKLRLVATDEGQIHLSQLPVHPGDHLDITIRVEKSEPKTDEASQAWPPGFFEQVIGGWVGMPLQRESQGDYEEREPLS